MITLLRSNQYTDLSSFTDVGNFVPLGRDKQGQIVSEVAPARFTLARSEATADPLPLYVALIRDWRRTWGQGEFPFLVVQLPNGPSKDTPRPLEPSPWVFVQEAQLKALALPNTGLAITIDLGEADIHPKRKAPVGERVALAARAVARSDASTTRFKSVPMVLRRRSIAAASVAA